MPQTMRDRLNDVHPKMLAASAKRGETECKSLAEQEWRARIGRTIERALSLAEVTKQEMSYAMGYQDQSAISRWIAGTERPLLDKLFTVDAFYDAWVIACAEKNPRLEVETVVRKRKSA